MSRGTGNYDVTKEQEAQAWIESVTGERFSQPFADQLKSGVTLCTLINVIVPGSVRRIESSTMPFKQMENISSFLRAARALGVAEYDLFETVDLYEQKDMGLVVSCIFSVGRKAQNVSTFSGPTLGTREATKNVRQFTKEQWKAGHNEVPKWNQGNHGVIHSSAATTNFYPLEVSVGSEYKGVKQWNDFIHDPDNPKGSAPPPAAAPAARAAAPPPPTAAPSAEPEEVESSTCCFCFAVRKQTKQQAPAAGGGGANAAPLSRPKFCPSCGHKLAAVGKFCTECGATIKNQ